MMAGNATQPKSKAATREKRPTNRRTTGSRCDCDISLEDFYFRPANPRAISTFLQFQLLNYDFCFWKPDDFYVRMFKES
jgi:hypothetical protein